MKYNIGDTVYIKAKIKEARVTEEGTYYNMQVKGTGALCNDTFWRKEESLADIDVVPLEDYEKEVNRLKGLIEELRRMP